MEGQNAGTSHFREIGGEVDFTSRRSELFSDARTGNNNKIQNSPNVDTASLIIKFPILQHQF